MKANPSKFVSANLPVNKFKNRLVNILPCEYAILVQTPNIIYHFTQLFVSSYFVLSLEVDKEKAMWSKFNRTVVETNLSE